MAICDTSAPANDPRRPATVPVEKRDYVRPHLVKQGSVESLTQQSQNGFSVTG